MVEKIVRFRKGNNKIIAVYSRKPGRIYGYLSHYELHSGSTVKTVSKEQITRYIPSFN